ncbi:MAG: mechanosensitive ion channel family protein [Deltaproteobacteria bacterium]|nr:mechanosensitive ion channel family protein [Deltaproteobacteria bacterium]
MEEEIQALETVLNTIIDFFVNYSFQVAGAILILIIGLIVARYAASVVLKLLERKDLDVTLSKFIAGTIKGAILVFVIIVALGKFGITVAPLIAAVTALAFGASFAIQGPLSNYGAGISIILSRPFVVGDTIRVKGVSGVVEEVKLATTILTDEDGVRITIPNKHIVGEIIHNSADWKIVEEIVGIGYGSDPEKAVDIIEKILGRFDDISKDPAPLIGIQEFADSSINIGLRFLVPTKQYFQTLYNVNIAIFKEFKENNIEIPFPQRDVHIISGSGEPLQTTS